MTSATLVTALTSLTKAMSVAAALVVFGFLYVLQVQPQQAAALDARERLEALTGELNRERQLARPAIVSKAVSGRSEPEELASQGGSVASVVDGVTAMLKSPSFGGVSNLRIATEAPIDSIAGQSEPGRLHTPVTVTFDGRYEQIGRFVSDLRLLPPTFELRGVEVNALSGAGTRMRAKVSLLVFHSPGLSARPQPDAPAKYTRAPAGGTGRAPAAAPAHPALTGILNSGGRRIALIDGRIVGPGDHVEAGIVQSIEPDAVVIATPGGATQRLSIAKRRVEASAR